MSNESGMNDDVSAIDPDQVETGSRVRRFLGIAIHSTPKTYEKREVTWLAMLETAIASSISIWIAYRYQTLLYIAIGASIAPVLLLRTADSGVHARDIYLRILYSNFCLRITGINENNIFTGLFSLWKATLVFASIASLSKLAGLFITVLEYPIVSFASIPSNWFRVAMTTDFFHPPEVIPSENPERDALRGCVHFDEWDRLINFNKLMNAIYDMAKNDARLIFIYVLMYLPIFVLGFFPAVIYRLSLKSTSLIYLPFLWVVRKNLPRDGDPSIPSGKGLEAIISDILDGTREKLTRISAIFSLLFFDLVPFCLTIWSYHQGRRFARAIYGSLTANIGPRAGASVLKFLVVS